MRLGHLSGGMSVLIAAVALAAAGCVERPAANDRGGTQPASSAGKTLDDHSQWWCSEHGIPEHECSMCLPDDVVNKMFKAKGDWCELHNRARSQCFKCDPTLKEYFAAKYRNRYDSEPPPIGEEADKKK